MTYLENGILPEGISYSIEIEKKMNEAKKELRNSQLYLYQNKKVIIHFIEELRGREDLAPSLSLLGIERRREARGCRKKTVDR